MKKCSKCNETLALTEFYKNAAHTDGLQRWCKKCVKAWDALRHRPYDPEKQKRYAVKRAEYRLRMKAIPEVQEARRLTNRLHYANNKAAYFAKAAARMSRMRLSAIVHDNPKNVAAVYARAAQMRKEGHAVEVDHIIPLNGKNVSGLHVSWNLQIIPAVENRRKGNKVKEQT